MNTKRNILFWLSASSIVLLSILVSFYTNHSNITTSIKTFTRRNIRLTCDETKWQSPLIAKYGVALTLTVDQKGCGKFNSLQKAVDAVPDNAPKPTLIIVDSGIYREKVKVANTKSNLIIQGQGYNNTFIVWGDTAANSNGTVNSYSVGVFAPKFIAQDISFKNTAPPPEPHNDGQAVAFQISGDQAAFYSCGFYGFQDTLLDDSGRHYFKNCFIEGTMDFIFGNGRSLYENCTLNSVATGTGINGAIAAQKRESLQENTGFSFVNCRIGGHGNIWLGRAWGSYSTTVFIKTCMPAIITPEGWNDMNDKSKDQKVFFGQHECCGSGSDLTKRVGYAKNLSVAEATPYMSIAYIDGKDWLHA